MSGPRWDGADGGWPREAGGGRAGHLPGRHRITESQSHPTCRSRTSLAAADGQTLRQVAGRRPVARRVSRWTEKARRFHRHAAEAALVKSGFEPFSITENFTHLRPLATGRVGKTPVRGKCAALDHDKAWQGEGLQTVTLVNSDGTLSVVTTPLNNTSK